MDTEPIRPDAIESATVEAESEDATPSGAPISEPTKIIRIASMTRAMLDEARQAPLDPAGRRRLLDIHERSLDQLSEVLSEDLRNEFSDIFQPLNSPTPSQSELRVAQAQLVGWLEGLFHGIQASLVSQQLSAQAQLSEVQQKAIESGEHPTYPGVYL